MKLFEQYQMKNIISKNRIISSAMFEYGAENGNITERIKKLYEEKAQGGSGIIITGMTAISKEAMLAPIMVNIQNESYIKDMKEIVDKVHFYDAKILVQLNDCRRNVEDVNIPELIDNYCKATIRVKETGADGIQIHCGHGFLLSSFLSKKTNNRIDEYGGNIYNRAKIIFEIYDKIREIVGKDYIISLKFPCADGYEEGTTFQEYLEIFKELSKRNVDLLEVTGGMIASTFSPIIKDDREEGYYLKQAEIVAENVTCPISTVAGIRTRDFAEDILKSTKIKFISLGRPITREPDLPNKWKNENKKADCISCNKCFASKNIIECKIINN